MWSSVVFCLLVGLALASNVPGWKDNTEYVYTVRGRTLAGLDGISNQHSGILLKATIRIQSRPDGKIQGIISEPQYSQIHSELNDGWRTYMSDSELTWKPLELSNKPFQAETKYGVITDLIVNKDVPNWEANIIKGMMSQFQINTNEINSRSSSQSKNHVEPAIFRVMEDTVTGNSDTLYEIKIKPRYMFESKAWESRMLRNDEGDVIEIVKDKNYTNSVELPSYFFGFGGLDNNDPATNKMGEFFIRHSTSRATLTGNMKRYTLHNSYTVNRIMVNPTLNDKQKGSVVSVMNVTLREVRSQFQIMEEVKNPVRLGNLVYAYEKPYGQAEVREKRPYTKSSHEFALKNERRSWRLSRSINEENFDGSEESYKQPEPSMSQAPECPFVPLNNGFKGKSVKYRVDIVSSIKELVQQIAREMEDPIKVLENSSTSKFVTLSSLVRIMNEDELKKAANSLHTDAKEGQKHDAWVIFVDALAASGTGPAFLLVQSLIRSDKLQSSEASHVLSTMSKAVRQPTFQYMKAYFELMKSPKVQSQWPLNTTAILSFSGLVREVSFDEGYSRKQFPVKSFVGFHTEEASRFIRDTVIPYLTNQLHESIANAETDKIHTYILALGQVAHPKILEAFEDYLEGKKQASQYQRVLMVLAMDNMVRLYPEDARSVLFRIYRNLGETQEVRIAAVYQIIKARPTVEILQHMAALTRKDPQEHVNAAVKSCIRIAAQQTGGEFHELRNAAIAAEPLLTEKHYGLNYGANYFSAYFIREINMKYKHELQSLGSEDEYYPKSLEYILDTKWGDFKYEYAHVGAFVSSVKELVRVGKEQTYQYQEKKQQQEARAEEQHQNPWSSQNIASLLNMKPEVREQLEGLFHSKGMGSMLSVLSFDNRTIERLPELIRKYQEEFENEKKFNFLRFSNRGDMAVSFPIEMGLPFLFTYDVPTIIQAKGKLQVTTTPKLSQGGKLHKPDFVSVKFEVYFTMTSKIQGRLSFSTPFDHQQYSAGFDKHWQLHSLPRTRLELDVKNRKVKVEIESLAPHKDAQMFHYSTWPYTSRSDIMNFDHSQDNTHIIIPTELRRFDFMQWRDTTGFPTRTRVDMIRQAPDSINLGKLCVEQGPVVAFLALWNDASIKYSRINTTYVAAETTTRKIVMELQYNEQYSEQAEADSAESSENPTWENIVDVVSAGIKNVKVQAINASVDFQGETGIKYTLTGAFAKSNVDPTSRLAVLYQMTTDFKGVKPFEARLQIKNEVSNTGAMDPDYVLESEPGVVSKVQLTFGPTGEESSKIQADLSFRRSENRKNYLKQLPTYMQCKHEMREGNKQLPACVNVTMEANLLDYAKAHVHYNNLPQEWIEALEAASYYIETKYWLSTVKSNRVEKYIAPNQLLVEARFYSDLKFVNVSVQSKSRSLLVPILQVDDMARRLFVLHPVFHLKNRVISGILGLKTFRPFCVVDKTQVSTFNNRTYPADISKHWTVLFQYVPKEAQRNQQEYVEEQLASQINNYVVLVRENAKSEEWKDVKMTISTPETDFQLIDITMTPKPQATSGPRVKVTVNGEQIQVSEDNSFDIQSGYIQIYALPGGEVKVEVSGAYYVIYDGERVRLTLLNGQFRNDIRGVCGQFNDHPYEDMYTSQNCFARNFQKFVQSYEVEGRDGQVSRKEFSEDRLQCVRKQSPSYVDVVPERSSERYESGEENEYSQTKYVYDDDEICFTLSPVVTCKHQQQARGYITRSVPVHCLAKSNVALLWKSQIDKGSSPNFSHKKEHKRVQIQIPQGCSQ